MLTNILLYKIRSYHRGWTQSFEITAPCVWISQKYYLKRVYTSSPHHSWSSQNLLHNHDGSVNTIRSLGVKNLPFLLSHWPCQHSPWIPSLTVFYLMHLWVPISLLMFGTILLPFPPHLSFALCISVTSHAHSSLSFTMHESPIHISLNTHLLWNIFTQIPSLKIFLHLLKHALWSCVSPGPSQT